ncbi:hypothetical protein HC024_00770 [Methylococcaceae bacterium WWC4]|nr:hypothetical protein [Methylococcaceae bacterium WWC4]
MLEIVKALSQTSLPEILAFAGVLFIFLSIGGKLGAQIITDNVPKRYAGIAGTIFLLSSLMLFVVSTIMQSQRFTTEITTDIPAKTDTGYSVEAYKLRPTLPMNQPISQLTEIKWDFLSSDKSTNCSSISNKEYIITILGRNNNDEPSVAKRKSVTDFSTVSCKATGDKESKVTKIHGKLEGIELLAHQTQDGQWIFDDPPGVTEEQKKAIRNEGFMDPFSGYPREKVALGKIITLKDEEISLILGTTFPGKKEGSIGIKLEHVINDKGPVALLSLSMNVSMTGLDESNNEFLIKMALNGGGRLSLSENSKINSTSTATGILSYSLSNTPNIITTGPVTISMSFQEL